MIQMLQPNIVQIYSRIHIHSLTTMAIKGAVSQQCSGFLITGNRQIKAVHFSGRYSNIHQALIQELAACAVPKGR